MDRRRQDVRALGARLRITSQLAHRGQLVQQLQRVADVLGRRLDRSRPGEPVAAIARAAPLGAVAAIHHTTTLAGDGGDCEPAWIAPPVSPAATIGKQTAAGHALFTTRTEVDRVNEKVPRAGSVGQASPSDRPRTLSR